MKYLGMCMLLFSISTLNIFGDEEFCDGMNVIFIQNLNAEQQENVAKLREEFLEEFSKIREKIVTIRVETQIEMRKEEPNWNEIKKLNAEYSNLQKILNEGIIDYRNKMQTIHVEFVN